MNMNDDLFPFLNAWKNWRFLFWQSSHNNPSTPFSDPKFIIPVAVVERMGDIKSIPKSFSVFPKKNHAYLNFEILQQYGFGCRCKESKRFWKWNNSRIRFFSSNLCFFNLVGVILILKSSRQGFEIFISKSQMFLLKRFGCSSHFFHSRISTNIYNDIFQVKDLEF